MPSPVRFPIVKVSSNRTPGRCFASRGSHKAFERSASLSSRYRCITDRWRMSTTRRRAGSAGSTDDAIDRPFARSILAEAERLAGEYQVTVWFDKEEGGWCGRCVELPLCVGFGSNPTRCVVSTREIVETTVAVMIENGEAAPQPAATAPQRTEQINGRLTKS